MSEPRRSPSLKSIKDGEEPGDLELTPAEAELATASYEALRALLAAYGRQYERLKAERSGLDFEDLQIRAVRLLRDRPAIGDSHREQFGHAMGTACDEPQQ